MPAIAKNFLVHHLRRKSVDRAYLHGDDDSAPVLDSQRPTQAIFPLKLADRSV